MHEISALAACGGVCAAGGTLAWAAVAPSSELFGATIRRTGNDSTIALTFDDGPNPAVTPGLLDLLDHHEVKATFFVIGEWVRLAPSLVGEIVGRGHTVGNHTNSHVALTFLSPARIAEELKLCDDAIVAATGHKPGWVRPPFGFRSPLLGGIVQKRGDRGVVMWSRWARDWKPQPTVRVARRLRGVRGGDIVLLHDGDHRVANGDRSHTVAALEYWLPRWKAAGFKFAALDAMQ